MRSPITDFCFVDEENYKLKEPLSTVTCCRDGILTAFNNQILTDSTLFCNFLFVALY